ELREDAQAISVPAHAPFEHGRYVQLLADLANVQVFSLEGEGGGAGDHANSFDVGETVDDLLGHAVGEVLVVLVAAEVHEGQDGDRSCSRRIGRGPVATSPEKVPGQAGSRREQTDARQHQHDTSPVWNGQRW